MNLPQYWEHWLSQAAGGVLLEQELFAWEVTRETGHGSKYLSQFRCTQGL